MPNIGGTRAWGPPGSYAYAAVYTSGAHLSYVPILAISLWRLCQSDELEMQIHSTWVDPASELRIRVCEPARQCSPVV